MIFTLPPASLARLDRVHPSLVAVVERAITISLVAFEVVQGVRTDAECYANFGKGRTADECVAAGCPAHFAAPGVAKVTWLGHPLSSNHRVRPDGFGHAVDLLPAPFDWKLPGGFPAMAAAMKRAAGQLRVAIGWGGEWCKSKDFPHFELTGHQGSTPGEAT